MSEILPMICVAAITGAGIITGLLFAFSNFVMSALTDLPAEKAMFAMQRINEKIINPLFMLFFLGTPVLCLFIVVITGMQLDKPGNIYLLAGALAYLVGPFGITMLFNVPLNNQLARSNVAEADSIWPLYLSKWQRWNHIRTYTGLVSIVSMAIGLTGIQLS